MGQTTLSGGAVPGTEDEPAGDATSRIDRALHGTTVVDGLDPDLWDDMKTEPDNRTLWEVGVEVLRERADSVDVMTWNELSEVFAATARGGV